MTQTQSRPQPSPQPSSLPWPHGPTRFELKRGNALTRVVTAIVGIPVILSAVWYGGWAFYLLIAAAMTGALLEFYWITEKRGAAPNRVLGVVAGLLLGFAFLHGISDRFVIGALGMGGGDLPETYLYPMIRFGMVLGTLLLFAVAVMIDQMFRKGGNPILNNMATFAGVTYIGLFMATLIGIRELFGEDPAFVAYISRFDTSIGEGAGSFGAYTVTAILASIWICDSAAYYAGRAFGRHKLFERVSPKKTWEGAIAGALAAVLTMVGMQAWLLRYLTVGDAIVLGVIVGVFGQLGDLAESHLKRDAGVKDSSHLIPGHGGVFDRFDSIIFVSPLIYLYLWGIIAMR